MPPIKLVSYLRVSRRSQGESGLGIEAQREEIRQYAETHGAEVVAEFVEVESGRKNSRPELHRALERCRLIGGTLILAKLDRLSRDALFLLTVVKESGEGGVVFCNLPQLPPGAVGKFMLTQMAAVAELEAGLISERTKAALQAAKARGTKLGNPVGFMGASYDNSAELKAKADAFAKRVAPTIQKLRDEGMSLRKIAAELDRQGIKTRHGKPWTAESVSSVMERTG